MANQNPQPEIYTTTHAFASAATAGEEINKDEPAE